MQWALGLGVTGYIVTLAWVNSKFKEKVSKDVFSVTVKGIHEKLDRLEETSDKIWSKIDKL